jgi:hypothetical protein
VVRCHHPGLAHHDHLQVLAHKTSAHEQDHHRELGATAGVTQAAEDLALPTGEGVDLTCSWF